MKWFLSRKIIEKYGVAAAVVGGVSIIGAVLFAFSQATTGPRLYVTPETQTVTAGSSLSVTVRADSLAEKVNSVQARLNYDPAQLQFASISETGPFSFVAATDTSTAGVVRVARAVPAGSDPVSGIQDVVTIKFTVLAGSGTIALNFANNESILVRASDSTNILAGTNGGSYKVEGGGSKTGTMTLSPATVSVATGQTFTLTIKENSGTSPVNSVQAKIGYDPAKIQYLSMAEGTVFKTQAATDTGKAGVIQVARAVPAGSAGVSGENDIVKLTFKMLATSGTADITIDKANSFVVTSTDNQDILGTVAGSKATVSNASSGAATLSMTPVDGTFATGSNVSVVIKANSPTAAVTTVQSTFTYPANQLEYVGTTNSTVFPTAQRTKVSDGTVDIIRGISGGSAGVKGENPVVTVNFKVIGSSGSSALAFTSASAVYDDSGTGTNILDLTSSTGANYKIGGGSTACATNPTTPGAPSGTSSTYTSISFGWTASSAGENCKLGGYKVLRNGTVIATVTNGTSYTDSGLTAGAGYNYAVRAFDTDGHESAVSTATSLKTKPDDQAPATPQGLTAAAPDSASVVLNWTASSDMPNPGGSGVAGYYVYRNNATTPTYTVTGGTTYKDTDVTAATDYSYYIKAYDKSGNISTPSNIATVKTPAKSCSSNPTAPTGLASTGVTMTSVSLSWNASTAAENCTLAGYKIYRGTTVVGTVTGTTFTETGLAPGTDYTYTVKAYDTSANHSTGSNSVTAKTTSDTTAPTAPATVSATAVSAGRVDITWTAATDDVAVNGYRLYRNGSLYRTLAANVTSYSDTLVTGSTDYSYQVSAIDAAGNESTKTAADPTPVRTPEAVDTQAPTAPSNLRRLASSTSAISIAWDASSDNKGVAGYHVYRNGQFLKDVSETSYLDSGLPANTSYTYTVKAFDASGNISAASNSLQAQTLAQSTTNPQQPAPQQPAPQRPAPQRPAPQQPRTPVQRVTPVTPKPVEPIQVEDDDVIETETPVTIEPIDQYPDGISKIEYYLNNKLVKRVNVAPYEYRIDTTKLLNGKYELKTMTYYANGTVETTKQTIIVDNPFGLGQMKLIAQKYALLIILLLVIVAALIALIVRKARSSGGSTGSGMMGGGSGGYAAADSGPVVTPTDTIHY